MPYTNYDLSILAAPPFVSPIDTRHKDVNMLPVQCFGILLEGGEERIKLLAAISGSSITLLRLPFRDPDQICIVYRYTIQGFFQGQDPLTLQSIMEKY
jgi:hypothetical protein